jgi:uncharacterized protein
MSITRIRSLFAPIVGVLLLTAACTVLPAQKDTSQFFILSAAAETQGSAHTDYQRELSIGLGPIIFPGYLKRREIVKRISNDRLQLSENMRWAESLDANFQSVLSQDLAGQLGTQRTVLFPWYGQPQIDYQIEVQVHRFDTDAADRSKLNARWIIKDGKTGEQLHASESNISSAVSPNDLAGSEALSNDINIVTDRCISS